MPVRRGQQRHPAIQAAIGTSHRTAADQPTRPVASADATLAIAVALAVPVLPVTRDLLAPFHALLRSKSCANPDAWLVDAANSLLGSFASGMGADRDAVAATITDP